METLTSKIGTVKEYLLSEETKKGLLALSVLVVLDIVIAVVGVAFSQSFLLLLSNVLFLEGALAFAVGAFVTLIRGSPNPRRKEIEARELSDKRAEEYMTEEPVSVHMPFGALLMLLGAILMALSVITGVFV